MSEELSEIAAEIDNFFLKNINRIRENSHSAWFEHVLRKIEQEYDRVLGYNRGYKEALEKVGLPIPANIELVHEAILELRARLDDLAAECAAVPQGRPKKTEVEEPDLSIARRTREIHSSGPFARSLRGAIMQAIDEHTATHGPLSATTTVESHYRRIRRIVESGLLPENEPHGS
jgi:hypothetical protein